ncbi:MAG: hypothetical protein GVY20_07210 [Bacteroidetes bacterium]|jgi:hypothetical protein|nr:hypothetical protein [Bacteroidota bacterium]
MNLHRLSFDFYEGIFLFTAILIITPLIPPQQMNAQVPVDHQEEIEVMILGTTHFGNPGQDVINIEFPDVLQPKYQRQQLGFKLAGKMNHDQVYSIDHDGDFPFNAVLDFAKEHQPEFVEQFEKLSKYVENRNQELVSSKTIPEILRKKNSPEYLEVQRHFYAEAASVGNDTTFVGADLVSKWHERNIKIFSNLSQIAEPGDRVIVIFGSGHAPLLRYFIESDLQMKLVEPNDYL